MNDLSHFLICYHLLYADDVNYLPNSNARPSLLIGQDHWDLVTATQTSHISREHPVASLTRLGWVIHGQLPCEKIERADEKVFAVNDSQQINWDPGIDEELNRLIKFYFTFDSIGVTNFQRKNRMEERAKQILTDTAAYKDGQWVEGRIEGRLNAVKNVPESVKSPIILDGKHHFTRLLIQHYHQRFHHGSTETVVNELKHKYWIVKIRPTIKSVISRCRFCRLKFAKPEQPRMGDLPEVRLGSHCRPFTFSGLDYFGPMYITIGRRREKRWGALFTCLTTRAAHLELASSLSADSTIMALRRMSNRRGVPAEIFSDNGTNFTGAEQELKEAVENIDSTKFQEELGNLKIKWRFIPPQTPHIGGTWERLVRSVKRSLSTILNERAPKEETLMTPLTEVSNTVNSRPLTNVSVDPRDQESLTPNHLLIGSSPGAAMCGEFSPEDLDCRRQWRIAQRLADRFGEDG